MLEDFFWHIFKSKEREVIEPPKTIIPSPLPSNYEQFRQEAFQVKAREEQKKMEVVTSYTQRTLAAYMSEEELTKLCEQIYPLDGVSRVAKISKYLPISKALT